MAELPLLDDGTSPVAVRAPNLTLSDLAFERRDRGFAVSKLDHAVALHTDVVEVEHRGVDLAAVDARGRPEVALQEEQVATPERSRIVVDAVLPPRACAPPRPSPVAVRAYELAVGNLCNHSLEAIPLAHQLADLHRLGPDMVELEYRGIREATVAAGAVAEDVGHVRPGDCATLVPGGSALPPMEISTLPHVVPAAVFAPALPAVEMRHGQRPIASIAMGRSQRSDLER